MDEKLPSLKISGPLLSKIFHESYCNEGYCGGMLFGEIISITKSEITDSEHRTSEHSTICVQDYRPISQKRSFFIHDQSDDSFSSNCVGFYRIRLPANRLSLLEKSMLRALNRKCASNPECNLNKLATLLITYDENVDISCVSWKIRAFTQKSNGRFSTVKVDVTNLQGSVLNSYITKPNPLSSTLSSGANATVELFQSSVSERDGKIKLVEATRDVTNNLIRELEETVDEFEKRQTALEDCYREKSALMKQLQILTAKINELQSRTTRAGSPSQPRSSIRQDNPSDVTPATQHGTSYAEDDYQRIKRQSLERMKLKSPVVLLKKIDLTPEVEKTTSYRRSSQDRNVKERNFGGNVGDVTESEDLIKFDDVA